MLAEASNFRIDFLPCFAWALLSDKCAAPTICQPVCHRNLQNSEPGFRNAINSCHHFPSGAQTDWKCRALPGLRSCVAGVLVCMIKVRPIVRALPADPKKVPDASHPIFD